MTVPLFLSDPDGEPDPEEYSNGLEPQRRFSLSFKLLMTASAAACVAMVFAWFTSDATRDVMISAKASIATVLPIPSTAAQAEASQPAQLTAADVQLKDPAQVKGSRALAVADRGAGKRRCAPAGRIRHAVPRGNYLGLPECAAEPRTGSGARGRAASRDRTGCGRAAPAAPQARKMDADELATLMKRAKELLAAGDIPVARLLLERAADGQDAGAALMLAQTYDPAVLGTSDVRNITPEPDKATQLVPARRTTRLRRRAAPAGPNAKLISTPAQGTTCDVYLDWHSLPW